MDFLMALPDVLQYNKQEIMDILLNEEYGYLPERPYSVTAEILEDDEKFCAGKARLQKLKLCCKSSWGDFSFPLYYARPQNIKEKVPCFIHINFRRFIPDKYQPTEEIIDRGFATLTFCYEDVTSDDNDFANGIAKVVYPDGKRKNNQCGKIGLWAWSAMSVMDYAQTLPELDKEKISVAGHSRLGKTALLTGALDERFYCAFSNDSGCSGASLSRNKKGESIKIITDVFPYWFCENYKKYADNEDALSFDQHFLISANVPHKVYVASAVEDEWADPQNEYLSCVEASSFYEKQGLKGFLHPDRLPKVGDVFGEGDIGYHLRAGLHYFSREDWNKYMDYLEK